MVHSLCILKMQHQEDEEGPLLMQHNPQKKTWSGLQEAHGGYQVRCSLRWTVSSWNDSWGRDVAGAASFLQHKNSFGLKDSCWRQDCLKIISCHRQGSWRDRNAPRANLSVTAQSRTNSTSYGQGFFMSLLKGWQLVGSSQGGPTVAINAASTSVLILADSSPSFQYFQAIRKDDCTEHINTIIPYSYSMHNFNYALQKYLTILWFSCFLPGGRDMLLV